MGVIHAFCILPAFDAEDYNATCGIAESAFAIARRPSLASLRSAVNIATVFVASGAIEIELKAFLSFETNRLLQPRFISFHDLAEIHGASF
ncbi:hypothetical protein ASD99_24590 [Mesorhizobium sp. Root695]|nr:hypothetical protein ASD99_24590 [Mesorhizobium sp. Root695]